MTTEAELWRFSLQVYSAPGVQGECLELQDRHGADVNLVLFCAYLGAVRSVLMTPQDLAASQAVVSAWHEDIVKRARMLRRALKDQRTAGGTELAEEIETLRNSVKRAELDSERLEQKLLARWADRNAMTPGNESPVVLAERNVLAYLNDIAGPNAARPVAPAALLRAAAAFVGGDSR